MSDNPKRTDKKKSADNLKVSNCLFCFSLCLLGVVLFLFRSFFFFLIFLKSFFINRKLSRN